MTAWVKIGLRNIVKNLRRSLITALAIALGFAAVNLFAGFTKYMYKGNRDVAMDRSMGVPRAFVVQFLDARRPWELPEGVARPGRGPGSQDGLTDSRP